MNNGYYLERDNNDKKVIYNIIEKLEKQEDKNYIMKMNFNVEIENTDEIIKLKILKENKERCINNIILDIFDDIERDNNEYILKRNENNILKVINRDEMKKKLEKNVFKYFKNIQGYHEQVQKAIFLYKQIILESNYIENLLTRDTSLSYLFFNIYEKRYSFDKKIEIERNIGNLLPELVPIILEFNIEKIENNELKLVFNLKLNKKKINENFLISKLRDFYQKNIYEKFEFQMKEEGYYIIDLKYNLIKEIYVEKEMLIDYSKSLRKIKINMIEEEREYEKDNIDNNVINNFNQL